MLVVLWFTEPSVLQPGLCHRQREGQAPVHTGIRHMDVSSMQHAESGFWAEGMHDFRTITLHQQSSTNEMLQEFLIPIVLFWEISGSNFNHMENECLTAKSHYKSAIYIRNCGNVPKPFSRTQTENEKQCSIMFYPTSFQLVPFPRMTGCRTMKSLISGKTYWNGERGYWTAC